MWNSIVSVPDHCLFICLGQESYIIYGVFVLFCCCSCCVVVVLFCFFCCCCCFCFVLFVFVLFCFVFCCFFCFVLFCLFFVLFVVVVFYLFFTICMAIWTSAAKLCLFQSFRYVLPLHSYCIFDDTTRWRDVILPVFAVNTPNRFPS